MYYWDGQQWVSTLAHDGRTRWSGSAWVPTGQVVGATTPQQSRVIRVATSWTRPLQYAVVGWFALQAVYDISLPFWMGKTMGDAMTQAMNQSIQRQQQLSPAVSPPPAAVTEAMNSLMTSTLTVALWAGAVFGMAISVVAIIGALKRWTWVYYVLLVLLGFSAISLPLNLINAVGGSAISAAGGFSMPPWIYWLGLASSIPATALFIWMLVALVQRGPWAMRNADPQQISNIS
jgi:hypothetical protein